jgi:hypothetical protein
MRLLGTVQHTTIEPLLQETMAAGTRVSPEAYSL